MYLSAGFSGVRVWTGLKGYCDNEKADPADRAGNGGKSPGEERKASGIYEKKLKGKQERWQQCGRMRIMCRVIR